jgi:hypothetical protein
MTTSFFFVLPFPPSFPFFFFFFRSFLYDIGGYGSNLIKKKNVKKKFSFSLADFNHIYVKTRIDCCGIYIFKKHHVTLVCFYFFYFLKKN